MISKTISLVSTEFGNLRAIGIKNSSQEKGSVEKSQLEIEQIYNFFYNFGLTNGSFYNVGDGRFGYFLIRPEQLKRITQTKNILATQINNLVKNAPDERFLIEHNKPGEII